MLAERVGAQVKFIHLDTQYRIDLEDLQKKLDDSVKVVSLQYASNVTGAVHLIEQVRDIIGNERFFCVDAAQMAVHGPLSMKHIQCDAMVFSGHKMMADTGIGVLALWKLLQKSWQAPIGGGGAINYVTLDGYQQAGIPERWEPGTPHITGAVTMTAALELLRDIDPGKHEHYRNLVKFVNEQFTSLQEKGIRVFHSDAENALGVWSFSVQDKHVNDIADAFAAEGICVRAGHHCCQPLHDHFGIP